MKQNRSRKAQSSDVANKPVDTLASVNEVESRRRTRRNKAFANWLVDDFIIVNALKGRRMDDASNWLDDSFVFINWAEERWKRDVKFVGDNPVKALSSLMVELIESFDRVKAVELVFKGRERFMNDLVDSFDRVKCNEEAVNGHFLVDFLILIVSN